MNWQPIETAPKDGTEIDVWLDIHASPSSFGWADAFRETEVYYKDGKWFHRQNGKELELYAAYITHWMPIPEPPV